MKAIQEILDVINNSNCSEAYNKFSSFPGFPVATDGVIALAEAAGCFWLLDIIDSFRVQAVFRL